MKNEKCKKRFEIFFLFLTINFFLIVNPTILKAQSNNLIGTSWKGTATFAIAPDTYLWNFNYVIQDSKEIRVHLVVAVSGFRQKLTYNMTTKSYETVNEYTTTIAEEMSEVGTYELKGNSIQMKFKSHQIDATLGGNSMVGKIIAYDGEKSVWSAERILTNAEIKKNELKKNIYGPWLNSQNLYTAILNFFIDAKVAEIGKNDDATKQEIKKLYESFGEFHESQFKEVSKRIATQLNRFLEKKVFEDTDFLPPKEPEKKNTTGSAVLADDLNSPYMWKISKYIEEIYVPVVKRKIQTLN